MRQDTLTSSPSISEDWSHALAGVKLTHTVHLVSSLSASVESTAAALFEGENAAVDRWAVSRCRGVVEQTIVLAGITERRAVKLRERLAALDGVLRTRVEHQFVRSR
ncbi:hypothetical protein F4827_002466 [Paraburkholderia bannensis]|uniref:Uncharacterized protein n=1 Tax=Paraburkholderia bannensis TaxID=765414 RepID=A0A7W9WSK6_9BURK|nr:MULTISPECIES: hypothetical protein [Paraburkholderia]MBB3257601.1 hypothetical protein [Paraburkholderia sp. WP4_3_2]MBB6102614.1 hypothetical protein [Paraburkholderia bannensis]